MRTPFITVAAANGVRFAVRYLPVRARYGWHNSRVVDDSPMIEFYDTRYATDSEGGRSGPLGQFVARYYADTILGTDGYGRGAGGLILQGDVPEWTLTETDMDTVREVAMGTAGRVDRSLDVAPGTCVRGLHRLTGRIS